MELIELLKKLDSQYETIRKSCLVIVDADLRRGDHTLDELDIHDLRLTLEDAKKASAVEYSGKLGYKILKVCYTDGLIPNDLPRITRSELGFNYV